MRLRSSFRVVWLASLYHRSNRVNKSRGENHNSGLKTDLRAEATSCWLHVSGLHHSGTGVLRMLIARNPLASIQSWSNSRFVEHESQWAQHSYPAFAARTNATCPPGSAAAAYTCPQLQALATPSTRHAIAKEWLAAHREPTKPILVQKNPTLDIGFLEHLFPRTAHALIMRHPFHWRIGLRTHCNHSAACRFDVWRAVWKETFEVLPTIRRYFVVQYEALPGFEAQVTAFAGRLCGGAPRRRLYLTGTDVHYDGAEASKYDTVWASDRASLTPWEPFVSAAFGYSLLHRGNATAGVRTGRFLATSLEPVVGGLEWVPRPARRA